MMSAARLLLAASLCAALSACAVGPNYRRPAAPPAPLFKEERGWVPATPAKIVPSAWWSIYDDPVLSRLERRVNVSNQTLKAAVAAYYAARAAAGVTRGTLFPSINLGAGQTRSGGGAASQFTFGGARTANEVGASGSWDIDLWGELRRELQSANAEAQVSAADVAAARLSAQTTLAADYFQLRAAEQQLRYLKSAVKDDELSLRVSVNQERAGVTTLAAVYSARTTLESTQSQEQSVELTRANLEHAIAVLIGEAPVQLSLAYGHLTARVPVVPAGVPSQLLLRNPAVAAAERTMASTNAEIGVEEAAWFPSLTLSGSYDFDSAALSTLIRASNAVWSFGPSFAENLFNGGATLARIREARATYDEAVADYRQTVLSTFEQVENDLATLRYLQVEYGEQLQAVADAKRAEHLTFNQYKAGTADYATLLSAQTAELSDEVTLVSLQSQRLVASVDLIDALGGGWNSTELDQANDGVHASLRSTVALPPSR